MTRGTKAGCSRVERGGRRRHRQEEGRWKRPKHSRTSNTAVAVTVALVVAVVAGMRTKKRDDRCRFVIVIVIVIVTVTARSQGLRPLAPAANWRD